MFITSQLAFIAFLQHLHYPHFIAINQFLSSLSGKAFLILLPIVYWGVNEEAGKDGIVLLMASTLLIWLIKDVTALPRPFIIDPAVKLIDASGYSFPSGDVWATVVGYGNLAYHSKNRYFFILTVILILLVAYSRMALGVHFPHDVIAGMVMGAAMLYLYFNYLKQKLRLIKIPPVIAFNLALFLPLFASYLYNDKTPWRVVGILSGFWMSRALLPQPKKLTNKLLYRIISILLGISVLIAIVYGVNEISWWPQIFKPYYLKGLLLGLWVGFFPFLYDQVAGAINKKK